MAELDEQDKIDIEVAAQLRHMMSTEGWTHYERILRAHIKTKEEEAMRTYSVARKSDERYMSIEDWQAIQGEVKGALISLRLALSIPTSIIQAADDLLAQLPPEERSAQ